MPTANQPFRILQIYDLWGTEPVIEKRVGEIGFPSQTPADRVSWLKHIMADRWPNLDPDLQHWRRQIIAALLAIETDTVVFTHFIAINVAVGLATKDRRVVCFKPDNASITVLETKGDSLVLMKTGAEADTEIR